MPTRIEKKKIRTRIKAALGRARISGDNFARSLIKRQNITPATKEYVLRHNLINSLTNWQRNQAGRSCKGNWSKLTIPQLEYYTSLKHWKNAAG